MNVIKRLGFFLVRLMRWKSIQEYAELAARIIESCLNMCEALLINLKYVYLRAISYIIVKKQNSTLLFVWVIIPVESEAYL